MTEKQKTIHITFNFLKNTEIPTQSFNYLFSTSPHIIYTHTFINTAVHVLHIAKVWSTRTVHLEKNYGNNVDTRHNIIPSFAIFFF